MPMLMCLITFYLRSKIVRYLQAFLVTAQPDTKKIAAQQGLSADDRHFKHGVNEATERRTTVKSGQ